MKIVLTCVFLLFAISSASAQTANEMFNLFGGLIRSGVAMSAQAAWQKIPLTELSCVDRTLRQQGSSINLAVQEGISPTDSRVLSIRSTCRDQSTAQKVTTDESPVTDYKVD